MHGLLVGIDGANLYAATERGVWRLGLPSEAGPIEALAGSNLAPGPQLYVGSTNGLYQIDSGRSRVVARWKDSMDAGDLELSLDGARLYVPNTTDSAIKVIDPASGSL